MYNFCYKSVFFGLIFSVMWFKKQTIFVVEKYIPVAKNFFGYIFFLYITLAGQGVSKGELATQVAGTLLNLSVRW